MILDKEKLKKCLTEFDFNVKDFETGFSYIIQYRRYPNLYSIINTAFLHESITFIFHAGEKRKCSFNIPFTMFLRIIKFPGFENDGIVLHRDDFEYFIFRSLDYNGIEIPPEYFFHYEYNGFKKDFNPYFFSSIDLNPCVTVIERDVEFIKITDHGIKVPNYIRIDVHFDAVAFKLIQMIVEGNNN